MAAIKTKSSIDGLGNVILRRMEPKLDNPLYKVTLDTTQEATIEVPDGFYTVEVLSGLVPETVRYLDGVVGIDELIVVGSASGGIGGTGSSGTVIIPMGAPVPLGTPAGTLIIRTP